MMVLGMLAWLAAAVSLWLGARRYEAAVSRGYRWLAAGAALYCSGLVVQGILGVTVNPAPGLSFTDLPALLAWPPWPSASPCSPWPNAKSRVLRRRVRRVQYSPGSPTAT